VSVAIFHRSLILECELFVSLEKQGRRSIGLGCRLGYLSNAELAAHSRSLEKRFNHEKLKV
jgi:hypothetical protein